MSNPSLSGTVASAPIGALGCDTLAILDAAHVKTLAANGFKFCVRYVNLPGCPGGPALTSDEAQAILSNGLALMVVQRARTGSVTADDGATDGAYAAQCCEALGLCQKVNVWLDLESIDGDVFGYENSWYDKVSCAGYTPGVYVGANIQDSGSPVTDQQLYSKLKAAHYWRSMSAVPNVEYRGYQMIQLFTETDPFGLGFNIDIDVTQQDYKEGSVQWLSPTTG